jgi:hypothetical protein
MERAVGDGESGRLWLGSLLCALLNMPAQSKSVVMSKLRILCSFLFCISYTPSPARQAFLEALLCRRLQRCDDAIAFANGKDLISLDLSESFDLLRGWPLDFDGNDDLDFS